MTDLDFYNFENSVIPQKLLHLFELHKKDIILHLSVINDSAEKYNFLNTEKSDKTFNELLFEFIDISKFNEIEIYKKANIDRRTFSKIRTDSEYHPSFGTVTLLALAIRLSYRNFVKLLHSASYSLPQNSYTNIALKYCFDEKIYDIDAVNELLFNVCKKQIKEL